jgi:hypothetical protein
MPTCRAKRAVDTGGPSEFRPCSDERIIRCLVWRSHRVCTRRWAHCALIMPTAGDGAGIMPWFRAVPDFRGPVDGGRAGGRWSCRISRWRCSCSRRSYVVALPHRGVFALLLGCQPSTSWATDRGPPVGLPEDLMRFVYCRIGRAALRGRPAATMPPTMWRDSGELDALPSTPREWRHSKARIVELSRPCRRGGRACSPVGRRIPPPARPPSTRRSP